MDTRLARSGGGVMDKHCKGCLYHHNAGHPKDSKYFKYNDWCIKGGNFAKKFISHCKLNNFKKLKLKDE